MPTLQELTVKFGADLTGFDRGVQHVSARLASSTADIQAKYAGMTQAAATAGRSMSMAITVPLAAGAAAGIRAFLGLEEQMQNVASISELTREQLKRLTSQVRELAVEFGKSAKDLASGLYDISSSGFQGAEAMTILRSSTLAATAGLASVAESAKGITAVLNAYGLSAFEAARVSDIMFQTVKDGVVTFPQLANSLGTVLATASTIGVPLEEVGAAIATMTKQGMNAEESVVRLNQVLVQLISPSKQAQDAAAAMGVEWLAAGNAAEHIKKAGLPAVMRDLGVATGGSAGEFAKLMPEVRAMQGAMALARSEAKMFAEEATLHFGSAGAAAKALAEQQKSLQFQLNRTKAAVDELGITVGEDLRPVVAFAASAVEGLTKTLAALPSPLRQVVEGVGAFFALLGPSLMTMSSLLQVYTTWRTMAILAAAAKSKEAAATAVNTASVVVNTGAKVANNVATGANTAIVAANTRAIVVNTGAVAANTVAWTARWLAVGGPIAIAAAAIAAAAIGAVVYAITKANKEIDKAYANMKKGSEGYNQSLRNFQKTYGRHSEEQLKRDLALHKQMRAERDKDLKAAQEMDVGWTERPLKRQAVAAALANYNLENDKVKLLRKMLEKTTEGRLKREEIAQEKRDEIAKNEAAALDARRSIYILNTTNEIEGRQREAWVERVKAIEEVNAKAREAYDKHKLRLDTADQIAAVEAKYKDRMAKIAESKAAQEKADREKAQAEAEQARDGQAREAAAQIYVQAEQAGSNYDKQRLEIQARHLETLRSLEKAKASETEYKLAMLRSQNELRAVDEQQRRDAEENRKRAKEIAEEEKRRADEQAAMEKSAAYSRKAMAAEAAGVTVAAEQWRAYDAYQTKLRELNTLKEEGIDVTQRLALAEEEYRAGYIAPMREQLKELVKDIEDKARAEREAAMQRVGFTSLRGMWERAAEAGARERYFEPPIAETERGRTMVHQQRQVTILEAILLKQGEQLAKWDKLLAEFRGE